ncbi:putative bifunctional diguanylate cyclase/phosphodiesterase [Salinispora tropica]|uniref:Diguanylate cyclase/phosphodiesterase n=1 Tax=Salinispora tropica (strain ATCC BAA-916 / DSM 44818 / JCM 13857 / NBRC 105044 / CNB-440) TaxID=369723 RepID=A4XBR6_SALTO|nr:sensor domain-containing phosphodiesterase [Salinispora tropica]ABP56373.1 diguanylate cyclase/phosphodiesterase [Salinispora tropica CNB-440]
MSDSSPPVRRTTEQVWLITAPLAMVAVFCTVVLALATESSLGNLTITTALLVAMVAASTHVLQIVVRRQALEVIATEIPLVLAFYYLPPLTVVAIMVLSAIVAQYWRRLAAVKVWFNVACKGAAASLGGVVLVGLSGVDGVGPRTWAVLFAAVTVNSVVSLIAISGVVSLLHGWQAGWELFRRSPVPLLVNSINVLIGLVLLLALESTWWSMLLIAVLAVAMVVIYRSYAQFLRQHRMLSSMYELTRAMTEGGREGAIADVLLGRIRALMQAEYATLWLPALGRYPEMLLSARVDDRGLLDVAPTPADLREQVRESGETLAAGRALPKFPDISRDLAGHGVKDVIVVPLRSGKAVIGTLEVVNRLSDGGHFTPEDIPVFETVAAHTAVALENSRLVDRLRYDAYHDTLTKLPNRRRVTEALDEAVKIRAPGEVVALLLFDVDRLREVNESLGRAAGDKVLVEVAARLRSRAPSSALVGRVGGDEFLVTLRLADAAEARDLAARMREQIRAVVTFDGLALDVDTAVGITVHPDHGSGAAVLLQRADLAVTAARSASGNVQLFNPALESRSLRRLGLAGDLRRALDNNELEVYFQPKVNLRDRRLVGVECLARWEGGAHGSVSPEDFVAVAEHIGQLGRLTEFVLREGLRRSRDWAHGGHPLSVAVNLSPRTLTDRHFPERVRELLEEYGVPPQRLTLEIRESGVLDGTDRPIPILRCLRELGVRLSVDDFGTGDLSLVHLRRLPVHEVKVDRRFVQGMATDPGDLAIVNAVVTLSQQFGLAVVAEGVESELTLELLQDIGCEYGQGFLFSRPLPYERLEAWFGAQVESEAVAAGEPPRLRVVP